MAAPIHIKLHGAEQFERLSRRMREMPPHIHDVMAAAIEEEGEKLGALSRRRNPVDTGALRSSYSHRNISSRFGTISVLASYSVPYAIYVHEKRRYSLRSTRGPPGAPYPFRQWFVKAAQLRAKGLIGRVIRKVRPELKKLYQWQRS